MSLPLPPSAQRVQEELSRLGVAAVVRQLDRPTRSAAEAAAAVGCDVGQIAKSLVFRGRVSRNPILVITSGANRVDEARVGALIGETLGKADAEFVRAQTGYAIGGVPPFGYARLEHTFMDEDLMNYEELWAAAGTPNAVFPLKPAELLEHASAKIVKVALEPR